MIRLKTLPDRLPLFQPATAPPPGKNAAERLIGEPWRVWYGSRRWKALRMETLRRDLFTCQIPECGRVEHDTSRLVCDHIEPHKGNPDLFWNPDNLQTLCDPCHRTVKAKEESADKRAASHPDWLRPSLVALTIVCGPPCGGKSVYVDREFREGDRIIDIDRIANGLAGARYEGHDWDRGIWLIPALRRRNFLLGRLADPAHAVENKGSRYWFIVGAPEKRWRQWWVDTLKPERVIVLATPEVECIRRISLDSTRDRKTTADAIVRWWFNYECRKGDEVIA